MSVQLVSMFSPVRPVDAKDKSLDAETGSGHGHEGPLAEQDWDGQEFVCGVCEDQPEPIAKRACPLPEVKMPSAKEYADHCLTHIPYRRWCPYCVAARMPIVAHRRLPPVFKEGAVASI